MQPGWLRREKALNLVLIVSTALGMVDIVVAFDCKLVLEILRINYDRGYRVSVGVPLRVDRPGKIVGIEEGRFPG